MTEPLERAKKARELYEKIETEIFNKPPTGAELEKLELIIHEFFVVNDITFKEVKNIKCLN